VYFISDMRKPDFSAYRICHFHGGMSGVAALTIMRMKSSSEYVFPLRRTVDTRCPFTSR